jgi:hypothetical protein
MNRALMRSSVDSALLRNAAKGVLDSIRCPQCGELPTANAKFGTAPILLGFSTCVTAHVFTEFAKPHTTATVASSYLSLSQTSVIVEPCSVSAAGVICGCTVVSMAVEAPKLRPPFFIREPTIRRRQHIDSADQLVLRRVRQAGHSLCRSYSHVSQGGSSRPALEKQSKLELHSFLGRRNRDSM